MLRAVGHQQDLVAWLEHPVEDAYQHHDADIVVEPRVDDQRLQGILCRTRGRRDARDDGFDDVGHALAGLRARTDRVLRVDADHVLDLFDRALGIGRGQIDLVEHRHDFHAQFDRGVAIGHRLRLDPLRRIDHQQRTFAGR